MRVCALLALGVLVSACGSDKNGSGQDLSVASGDLSAEAGDLSLIADMSRRGGGGDGGYSTDAGMVGGACQSACDCMPGLGCFGGKCTAAAQPVYCCGAMPCPNNSLCQHSDGMYGRCGGAGGMPPDLANFDVCPLINCNGPNGTARCTQAGCTMCVQNMNGGMSCAR